MGFVPEVLEYRGCEVTIFDLGGGAKIRPVWTKYFSEVHGVIFVIDSSADDRLTECKKELVTLLSHKRISGKPVLILANKQDVEGAMDEMDIVETLQIEEIVNKYKCPTRVETCSALSLRNKKPDKPIADGFRWLVDTIVVHYNEIHKRVERDVEKERLKAKKELDEIKSRIRHRQAERERQEELQRRKNAGETLHGEEEGDDEVVVVKQPTPTELNNSSAAEASHYDNEEEDSAVADPTPSEAQELQELGFSAIDTEPSSTNTSPASRRHTQRSSNSVKGSPTLQIHRLESGVLAEDPNSHRIIVVSSPQRTVSVSSAPQDSSPHNDSGYPSTPANGNPPYPSQENESSLRLHDDSDSLTRTTECVPIDSDDELYNMDQREYRASPRYANGGSFTSIVKEQLELESTSAKTPKKKSFLKRYHKTVPVDTSDSVTVS